MTNLIEYDRSAQYEALTPEQHQRVWREGNIVGVPIQCEYCDQPGAWATVNGPTVRIACSSAVHIAYVESIGSQAYPDDVADIAAAVQKTELRYLGAVVPEPPECCSWYPDNFWGSWRDVPEHCPKCGRKLPR